MFYSTLCFAEVCLSSIEAAFYYGVFRTCRPSAEGFRTNVSQHDVEKPNCGGRNNEMLFAQDPSTVQLHWRDDLVVFSSRVVLPPAFSYLNALCLCLHTRGMISRSP